MILCQVKFSGLAWTQELKEELCDIMELCTIFRYSFICRSAHACSLWGVSTFGACARSDWEESSRVTVPVPSFLAPVRGRALRRSSHVPIYSSLFFGSIRYKKLRTRARLRHKPCFW